MKKTGMMLGLCIAMGLSTASFAGAKDSHSVYVNVGARIFVGIMGAARNSPDSQQTLYCYVYSSGFAHCLATDASGISASCVTGDAELLSVIRSLHSDSYLEVSYDSSGACTNIVVGNASIFEPKQP
ncbi:hypothetical protein HMI49_01505 [Corallococcus exercitus]|uniref:Uncharacterized protein n=1 Tax=Corallococcus exercitus TaxID=2316736 RepID=A0A7Y4KDP4_9BACT|nr:hypothetical protein [Corallococcus exercitus]NOK31877.1 hypothetical protein [Corallococcus exercitus]